MSKKNYRHKGDKKMNILKLKGRMVENGFNVETLAEKIGIDRSSLYRKLNTSEKITIGEAKRIKDALDLSEDDATAIFFS